MARERDDPHALLDEPDEREIARAREEVDKLDNVVLNIAITGVTGAGKSTLVNVLRGVEDTEPEAAQTGVTETTIEVRAYPHLTMPNVNIWDLPGIGSTGFRAETYLKKVQFQNYDFFIIVNAKRFKEEDIMLAKEIEKQNKNFYFIRTMIDQDVQAAERKGQTEEQTLHEIREYCKTKLREKGPPPIFLISAWYPEKYDFQNLQRAFGRDLPQHKRDVLILSLPVYSRQSLDEKYEIFKKQVWALAVMSGGIAAVPMPGLSPACDTTMVISFFTKCYYSFGLNDKSLERMGKKIGNETLKKTVRDSSLVTAIATKTFFTTKLAAKLGAAGVVEAMVCYVPVAGNIAAAGVSFATTRSVLLEGLKELYSVAQKVLQLAGLE